MNLKIAICDDDPKQRDYLHNLATAWAETNHHLIELKEYPQADTFLFDWDEKKDLDILLLDIEMPGINGIELAKTIRKDTAIVQIIFVTGYYDYFSDGFDVSALHYLIKPVDNRKLFPVLNRAADNLRYRERSVFISTPELDVKVSLADITYIESENVYIVVHTVRGNYRTRVALSKFQSELDETFIKVHRSYIVGLKYIKKISRSDITMTGGDIVPISRGMYDAVHSALIKYL